MAWLAGWKKRIELAINDYAGDIGGEVTWFPATIHLKDANGDSTKVFLEVGANYKKIAITKADGETELYGEVEAWNYNAETPANSTAVIHTSADGWVIDSNTKVYVYYDKDHADNTDYIGSIGNAIDVGSGASDELNAVIGNLTYIALANPANLTGKITNIAINVHIALASAKVATFYVSGGKYTARSASGDLGIIAVGLQNFAVDLDVVAGDFIGIYFTDGGDAIHAKTSGGSGVAYLAGDQTACKDATFSLYANYAISLYGTGGIITAGTNVWDDYFKMVQHMVDATTSTIKDSTSNNNDGTKKGAGEPASATGKVGLGQNFDGSNDYINLGIGSYIPAIGTMELVVKPDFNHTDNLGHYFFNTNQPPYYFGLLKYSDNNIYAGWYTNSEYRVVITSANYTLTAGTYYYITLTWDDTANETKLYFNTVQQGSTVTTLATYTPTTSFLLGIDMNLSGQPFDGIEDEVRLSNVVRTAAWEKAAYNSLFDTLFTYGDEEVGVIAQSLAGILTVSGIITNKTNKNLTGILTSTGDITNSITKLLSGVITFAGDLAAELVAEFETFYKSIAGTLNLTGEISKKIYRNLAGILTFGAIAEGVAQFYQTITGSLILTGSVVKNTYKSLSGAVEFTGIISRILGKLLVGIIDFSGNIVKNISHNLAGTIEFIGKLINKISLSLTGVFDFTGSIIKSIYKNIEGVFNLSGRLNNLIKLTLSGAFNLSGITIKSINKVLTGTIGFTGTLIKKISISLSGILDSIGAVNTILIKIFYQNITGILNFTGDILKKTSVSVAGTFNFIGSLTLRISIMLSGVLNFIGSVITGLANFYYQSVTGILDFTGSIVKKTSISLSGVFNFTGIITKLIDKLLTGIIELSGIISRLTNKLVSGIVTFTGNIIGSIIYAISLTGIVSFTGETSRVIGNLLEGTITFAGSILKRISTVLRGILDFVGSVIIRIGFIFTRATLSIESTDTVLSIINNFSSLSVKNTDTEISIINDYSDISIKDTDTEISISN